MNDAFRLQSYEIDLQTAVELHIGDLITPYSLAALRNHIAAIRAGF